MLPVLVVDMLKEEKFKSLKGDQNIITMRDKIVALTTSTSADMVKFKASHLYFDEEKAVGYLSLLMVGYFRSNNFIDLSKFNIVFNICCFYKVKQEINSLKRCEA